jgi:hypothetical protein
MRKTFCCVATALLLMLVATPLCGQEKLSPAAQEAAFAAALAKAQGGDIDGAIFDWEMLVSEAEGKVLRECHFNLAAAYDMKEILPVAWFHLDTYLRLTPNGDKAARAEQVRVEDKLAKKGYTRVTVSCQPTTATVRFVADRERQVPCPATWWFAKGVYHVEAFQAGFKTASSDIEVAGAALDVPLTLRALPKKGTLVVAGDGRAVQVFLNGQLEGSVPFRREIPEGTYQLMVGKPGEMPWQKQITITAGEVVVEEPAVAQKKKSPPPVATPIEPTRTPPPPETIDTPNQLATKARRDLHLLEWSLIGTGIAIAAGGAVMQGLAASRNDELTDEYPADATNPQLYVNNRKAYNDAFDRDVQPKLYTAYGLYAAGALAVGAGTTILLINVSDKSQARKKAFSLAPVVLPDGGAVTFGFGW